MTTLKNLTLLDGLMMLMMKVKEKLIFSLMYLLWEVKEIVLDNILPNWKLN